MESVCAKSGCPAPVSSGYCPTHRARQDQARGSAAERGYDYYWHATFRPHFIALLVAANTPPVCGAKLPNGPVASNSRCRSQGLMTTTSADGSALHLNHEPPLSPEERHNRAAVCDPARIELLCRECHTAATRTI